MFFIITNIILVINIVIFIIINKHKFKKLSSAEKFILYCEKENISFEEIQQMENYFIIFNIMAEYKPYLFAKYFKIYDNKDINSKREYIKAFDNKKLRILFKYSNGLTLRNIINILSQTDNKRTYFMLNWLCENRFSEFLPLIQMLDKDLKHECFSLVEVVREAPDVIKFLKYVENFDYTLEMLAISYGDESYIYDLAREYKLLK